MTKITIGTIRIAMMDRTRPAMAMPLPLWSLLAAERPMPLRTAPTMPMVMARTQPKQGMKATGMATMPRIMPAMARPLALPAAGRAKSRSSASRASSAQSSSRAARADRRCGGGGGAAEGSGTAAGGVAWIASIAAAAAGNVNVLVHLGHFTRRPARFSGAFTFVPQLGQLAVIGMSATFLFRENPNRLDLND